MKKLLLFSYDFPPHGHRGSGNRAEKLVKYLPDFGWKATVLASLDKQCKEKDSYENVVRFPSLLPFPSPYNLKPYGWALRSWFRGRRLIAAHHFDAMMATCPPFPTAVAAAACHSRAPSVPFILDFRDAWLLNPYVRSGTRANRLIGYCIVPRLEKYSLLESHFFIANTPSMLEAYEHAYPFLKGRIKLLPNGFDEDDYSVFSPGKNRSVFQMLYCGRFTMSHRSPEILLEGISILVAKGFTIRFQILGDDCLNISRRAAELGLSNCVEVLPAVHPRAMVRQMQTCGALVLYQAQSDAPVSAIAGKTYEYLRTGKPILALAPPGDNVDLIKKFSPSSEIVSSYDVVDVSKAIERLYLKWQGDEDTAHRPNAEYVKRFNRRRIAATLVEIIEEARERSTKRAQ